MRVIERAGRDLNELAHAAAFQVRLRSAVRFVEGINDHADEAVYLLAVRDGKKFDFVLKDTSGAVLAVMLPIVSGSVEGMHLQMTGSGATSGEFGFSPGELAAAADMLDRRRKHSSTPGIR